MLKFKALLFTTVLVLFLTIGSAFAEESQPRNYDFVKINQIIANIVGPVVMADDLVEEASLVVDEAGTNIEENRAKLILTTTLSRTAWSRSPASFIATLSGQAHFRDSDEGPVVDVVVSSNITVKTDTLAMFKHSAQVLHLENECEELEFLAEDGEVVNPVELYVCRQLFKLSNVSSYPAFGAGLQDLKDDVIVTAEEYIALLEEDFEAATPENQPYIQAEIDATAETRDFAASLVVSVTNDTSGAFQSLRVSVPESIEFGPFTISKLEAVATAGELQVSLDVTIESIPRDSYDQFTVELRKYLAGIEDQNPEVVESAKELVVLYIAIIKGYAGDSI